MSKYRKVRILETQTVKSLLESRNFAKSCRPLVCKMLPNFVQSGCGLLELCSKIGFFGCPKWLSESMYGFQPTIIMKHSLQ